MTMEFDLHSNVRDLIQSHANPADINRAAAEFYHTGIDCNILLCYAIHYGHKQYIIEVKYDSCSSYSPLITAVYNKAHDIIQLMFRKLDLICYTYHEGFGKLQNDKLITDKAITIWEAIFEIDDTKTLQMLLKYCFCALSTLVRLTNIYGARNCYEALTNTCPQLSAVPLDTTNAAAPSVENNNPNLWKLTGDRNVRHLTLLALRTCTWKGKITSLIREDTLLMWNSQMKQGMKNQERFVTSSDEKTLSKLLSGEREELVLHCQQECDESSKALPVFDDSDSRCISGLDLHSKIILECWQWNLDNADLDILEDADYIHRVQSRLTHRAVGAKYQSTVKHEISNVCAEKSLFLLNTMMKMLLQSGAKFRRIFFFTDILKLLYPEPCLITLPVTNQFCKHLMILIVYCHSRIIFARSNNHNRSSNKLYLECSTKATYVRGACRVILSMIPHAMYEAYRLDVKRRQELLVKELNKNSPNGEEIMKLKRKIENIHDVSTPRTLQQLCRLKLYQIIPGRKLPETVAKLEIPDFLKHMLTLGVLPDV